MVEAYSPLCFGILMISGLSPRTGGLSDEARQAKVNQKLIALVLTICQEGGDARSYHGDIDEALRRTRQFQLAKSVVELYRLRYLVEHM